MLKAETLESVQIEFQFRIGLLLRICQHAQQLRKFEAFNRLFAGKCSLKKAGKKWHK